MKILLLLLSASLLLAGCTRSAKLTVVNASPSPLTNIVASVSGTKIPFSPLAPGAQQQVELASRPGNNAVLKLDFEANGKHFTDGLPNNSWNGMKEVILTVTNNFSVISEGITSF